MRQMGLDGLWSDGSRELDESGLSDRGCFNCTAPKLNMVTDAEIFSQKSQGLSHLLKRLQNSRREKPSENSIAFC